MSRRPLVAALVAAAAAGGLSLVRRALPAGASAPWERTNHAGRTVTLLEGPIYALAAAAGSLAAGAPCAPGVVASVGSAAFGALDDLAGDSSSKGLKGHLGALARGDVTTGAVKIVGIGATGLVAAALSDRRTGRGMVSTLVGGAAIAGAANLANLFDLRPGRTLKVTVLAGLPVLLPGASSGPTAAVTGVATAAAALGAAAGTLPDDLRGSSMLGDTGANAAGAMIGLAIVERTGLRGRLAVLVVAAGLTVLSEKVSFSKVIDDTPVLRRLDRWGRGVSPRSVGQSVAKAALVVAVATLLARLAGFARTMVFSGSVGTSPVGDTYQTVNTLPNVVYEVAAGGALAAIAVPLVAGQLGAGRRDDADRSASALLTWAVVILVPLSAIVFVAAPWLSDLLLDDRTRPGSVDLGTTMLRIFAPQVALYGIGVVLAGVLQAHRRFLAAALAPLFSSLVVILAYVAYGSLVPRPVGADAVESQAIWVLAGGTTLGVLVLSLPLLVPALRTGTRLRPTLTFPGGLGRRAASLAGAGVLALAAQQAAVALTLWLTHEPRTLDTGVVNVYAIIQALYLLPYAVLAVPVATAAFPALAHAEGASADSASPAAASTLSRSVRGVILLTSGAAATLITVAQPVGEFFLAWDRGATGAGRAALSAMPGGLAAYAPGLVGFSIAALLTRALYVRGRPFHAAAAVAGGWLVAGLLPLAWIPDGSDAGTTLGLLGVSSTLGMTGSAIALALLVRRAWGSDALAGTGRTIGAAVVSAAVAIAVGDTVARLMDVSGLLGSLLAGVVIGAATMGVHLVVMSFADRAGFRQLVERGRRRREDKGQEQGQ